MKKILFATLFYSASLVALPVMNPASPQLKQKGTFFDDKDGSWGFEAGYRGDFVSNRNVTDIVGDVKKFGLFVNEALFALNIFHRVELYGFVGTSSYDYSNVISDRNNPVKRDSVYGASSHKSLAGGGFKAVLVDHDWGRLGTSYLGVDIQFETVAADDFYPVTIDGVKANSHFASFKYHETQISLGVAHKIWQLVPYIAAKWSLARGNNGGEAIIGSLTNVGDSVIVRNFKSRLHYGFVIGASIVAKSRMTVTAEARFVDESAFSVLADIRF